MGAICDEPRSKVRHQSTTQELELRDVRRSLAGWLRRFGGDRRGLAASALATVTFNLLVVFAAAGQTAIDGDSLRLNGKGYSLHGIDAAEAGQVCPDGWPAGVEARRYLQELIARKDVVCTSIVGGHGPETNAVCRADGIDVGGAMVTAGQAFAYVPYSARYIGQEAAAAQAGRGVHGHHCMPPWRWRSNGRDD